MRRLLPAEPPVEPIGDLLGGEQGEQRLEQGTQRRPRIVGLLHVVFQILAEELEKEGFKKDSIDTYLGMFKEITSDIEGVRYCREKGKDYSYRAFADEIDTILKELIQYDIALEINTGGYKAGLGVPNPTPDVIRRYRELGGEKITFGADAHKPEHIAFHFADAAAIAQEAGFRYYVRFKEKKPEYLPIQ